MRMQVLLVCSLRTVCSMFVKPLDRGSIVAFTQKPQILTLYCQRPVSHVLYGKPKQISKITDRETGAWVCNYGQTLGYVVFAC